MLVAVLAAWVATSLWVGLDAARRVWTQPVRPDSAWLPRPDRPWQWVLAVLVLWPVVFPIYVYRRAHVPLKPSAHS